MGADQGVDVQIGMLGLGRMGAGMARRLLRGAQDVVVHDLSRDAMTQLGAEGARPVMSVAGFAEELTAPRAVWVMLPAGPVTERALEELRGVLAPGDVVIDGGNSHYTHSQRRGQELAAAGLGFLDVGTSGGIWGLDEGFCLMVGGQPEPVAHLREVFDVLAPFEGWSHVGPSGSGHYTKMIHNGVEYGLMQAYAEGFELLREGPFALDVADIAEVWRHGSVVRSWLLDLAARALEEDPSLDKLSGYVEDSGEGRWTLDVAIESGVPAPVIAAALFARFASRRENTFGNRMLAALRNQFGGHAVRAIQREDHE